MSEQVYKAVQLYFDNHDHKWLNKYIFNWESDFFCVSNSGYCIEVEVKVSKSDFKADFKKPKHDLMKAALTGQKYWLKRLEESTEYGVDCGWNEVDKHQINYGYKQYACTPIRIHDMSKENIPNKFWYACPENLLSVSDVPKYAGLIYVYAVDGDYPNYKVIKAAPFIHKRKLDVKNLLFDKYFWDRISLLRKVESLEYALKNLKRVIEV